MPIRRRVVAIVTFERGFIILAVVSERCPASLEPAAVPNQDIPVMVAHLVPEMPKQRPVGLIQLRPALLALGAVRLGQRNGDDTLVMPRHDLRERSLRRIGQKFESQAVTRVLGPGLERQPPAQEAS